MKRKNKIAEYEMPPHLHEPRPHPLENSSAGTSGRAPAPPLVALSATFTAEPVRETLAFWFTELGYDYRVKFASYNQLFQQLLDPAGLFATNRQGFNIVLARLEDWARFADGSRASLERLEADVRYFVSSLRSAAQAYSSPFLVCVCPASPGFLADPERAALNSWMEEAICSGLSDVPTIHLTCAGEVLRLYPVEDIHDPHADQLGHVPYTPAFFAALGTMLARKIHAVRRAPYKVISLDCDETLWQGICGEDGPQGVVLDPPRRALQEFMRAQHDRGMLLTICSKNNEEDVLETFRQNPDWPLRPEHFAAHRINWDPKSVNLHGLADELQLGLDSFIFIDDLPKECAEVQADCPEVLTLPLPADAGDIPAFLEHVWAFDHARVTEEDRRRAAMYAQRIERVRLQKQASSLEEFLASLELDVRIAPASAEQIPRIAQLTQRTNQMNCTTIRRSESEVQALLHSGAAECLTVDVRDRFGSYGLTGIAIFAARADALVVDTFLLSCRVLGRGVEHRLLARLGEIAEERGLVLVDVPFVQSQRNRPALLFLESVGAQFRERRDSGLLFRFPAGYARALRYRPESAPAAAEGAAPVRQPAGESPHRPIDYVRIATELRTPEQVLERVRGLAGRNAVAVPAPSAAPRTELEARLAAMWAELLGLEAVGIQDNFFDLGGHSLLAVELLSRVRQAYGADLSLEVVYGGAFTVEELAKAIEFEQIAQADTGDYADILQELEGLSEEEVRALLAREQSGNDK